jgi:hypothetical protein
MSGILNFRRSDVQYTAATSINIRSLASILCLWLGFVQAAAANSNETIEIWKSLDEFVVLAPQDTLAGDAAPRNDQPIVIEPATLAAALAKLRVHEGKGVSEGIPVFESDAARRLAGPLSTALARAAADQDVLFAIGMSQKALVGSKPVSVAGRAFYQNQRLQLIIGELHVSTIPPEYKNYPIGYPKPDRRLHPHKTGERAKESHYDPAAVFQIGDDVSLFARDGKVRSDWLVLNVGALATPDLPTAAPTTVSTGTTRTSGTSQNAPPGAGVAKPSGSPSPSIEERLLRLKRLREQDLITDEEYKRKRNEILDQL